jgi:hypothetical protein
MHADFNREIYDLAQILGRSTFADKRKALQA